MRQLAALGLFEGCQKEETVVRRRLFQQQRRYDEEPWATTIREKTRAIQKRDEEKERMDGDGGKGTARGWLWFWREGGRLRECRRMEEWEGREWERKDGTWKGCVAPTVGRPTLEGHGRWRLSRPVAVWWLVVGLWCRRGPGIPTQPGPGLVWSGADGGGYQP